MENDKICPLLSIQEGEGFANCKKEKCEWWTAIIIKDTKDIHYSCAIVQLALQLRG